MSHICASHTSSLSLSVSLSLSHCVFCVWNHLSAVAGYHLSVCLCVRVCVRACVRACMPTRVRDCAFLWFEGALRKGEGISPAPVLCVYAYVYMLVCARAARICI